MIITLLYICEKIIIVTACSLLLEHSFIFVGPGINLDPLTPVAHCINMFRRSPTQNGLTINTRYHSVSFIPTFSGYGKFRWHYGVGLGGGWRCFSNKIPSVAFIPTCKKCETTSQSASYKKVPNISPIPFCHAFQCTLVDTSVHTPAIIIVNFLLLANGAKYPPDQSWSRLNRASDRGTCVYYDFP